MSADAGGSRLAMRASAYGIDWLSAKCSPHDGACLTLGPHFDCISGETPSHAILTATKSGARCETTSRDHDLGRSTSASFGSSLDGRARLELFDGRPFGGGEQGGEILLEAGARFGPAATFTADGEDRVRIRSSSAVRTVAGAVETRPTPFIVLTGGDGATAELRPVEGSGK
jgi:hypothetical protein